MPKRSRQCLFCDHSANSGEHLWSQWMSPQYPKTTRDKSQETWRRIGPGGTYAPQERIYGGHPTNRKINCVCRDCNSGWMGELESEAKPTIEPMMRGRRTNLNRAAQETVTRWLTLKMMVFEQADRGKPPSDEDATVFTRTDTLAFRDTLAIPGNMRVWLFRSRDREIRSHVTRAFSCLVTDVPIPGGKSKKANVQTVLFGAGQLVAFVAHSRLPEFELGEYRQTAATRIWPIVRDTACWPPLKAITSAQARHIALTLDRYVSRPGMIRF